MLYYAAVAHEFDYGGSGGGTPSHLMRYDIKRSRVDDLGEMVLDDGRPVFGTNAADTAPDGTVYFVGAIEARAEAGKPLESAGRVGGRPYRLALLAYRPH